MLQVATVSALDHSQQLILLIIPAAGCPGQPWAPRPAVLLDTPLLGRAVLALSGHHLTAAKGLIMHLCRLVQWCKSVPPAMSLVSMAPGLLPGPTKHNRLCHKETSLNNLSMSSDTHCWSLLDLSNAMKAAQGLCSLESSAPACTAAVGICMHSYIHHSDTASWFVHGV